MQYRALGAKRLYPLTLVQALRYGWCLLVVWAERVVFYQAAASCGRTVPRADDAIDIVIIADPQVIGRGTYSYAWPLYRLARLVSDVYLSKAWLTISGRGVGSQLFSRKWRTDFVVFLGDMSDRGRWSHEKPEWRALQRRWERIYQGTEIVRNAITLGRRSGGHIPALLVPGNHDIGLPRQDGAPQEAYADAHAFFRERYGMHTNASRVLSDSGALSHNARIPLSTDGESRTHELVLINALDLVGMEPIGTQFDEAGWETARSHAPDTTAMLGAVSADVASVRRVPRILFSHVPLSRGLDELSCDVPWRTARHGMRRESQRARVRGGAILQGGGIDKTYQNLVLPRTSNWVLDSVQPAVVFSGDDHDHCETIHRGIRKAASVDGGVHGFAQTDTPELTVKSISMLEGVRRPGYARLRLYGPRSDGVPSLDYEPCVLPDQMALWLYVYLPCFVLTIAFMVFWRMHRLPLLPSSTNDTRPSARQMRTGGTLIFRDIIAAGTAPILLWGCFQLLG